MNSRRTRDREEKRSRMRAPAGHLVSTFIRFYGMEAYHHPRWPTRDHLIPFELFYAMLATAGAITAAEQYRHFHAARLAVGAVMASEEGRSNVQRAVDELVKLAFPEIPVRTPRFQSESSDG